MMYGLLASSPAAMNTEGCPSSRHSSNIKTCLPNWDPVLIRRMGEQPQGGLCVKWNTQSLRQVTRILDVGTKKVGLQHFFLTHPRTSQVVFVSSQNATKLWLDQDDNSRPSVSLVCYDSEYGERRQKAPGDDVHVDSLTQKLCPFWSSDSISTVHDYQASYVLHILPVNRLRHTRSDSDQTYSRTEMRLKVSQCLLQFSTQFHTWEK